MRKIIVSLISLSLIVLAALFVCTCILSSEDSLLMMNVDALAQVQNEQGEDDYADVLAKNCCMSNVTCVVIWKGQEWTNTIMKNCE